MADIETDVVVVGAGPAGSTFARIAAQHGLDVVVFDKRKEIGNPVRCGEGLGVAEVMKEGLDLPRYTYSIEIYGAKVVGPKGQEIILRNENTRGWVLERKYFDKWLAELAIGKGAKVYAYHRAFDVKRDADGITLYVADGDEKVKEIRAKMLISAEGMEALIARKLGFPTVHRLYDVDTCYQYEMEPYDHENLIELYFGNEIAPRGYVWIFPKAHKRANVGIGIGAHLATGNKRGGLPGATPKVFLDKFIVNDVQLKEASSLLNFGGVISVGEPINKFVDDRVMVIGTAAKQVDPIHGGGIELAMEAGVMAAEAAAKAFEKSDMSKDFLYNNYEAVWRSTRGKEIETRLKLRKALESLSDDDLNHIFDTLSGDDVLAVMEGKLAGPIAKVLKGRPSLLKVLKPLMLG